VIVVKAKLASLSLMSPIINASAVQNLVLFCELILSFFFFISDNNFSLLLVAKTNQILVSR